MKIPIPVIERQDRVGFRKWQTLEGRSEALKHRRNQKITPLPMKKENAMTAPYLLLDGGQDRVEFAHDRTEDGSI